MHDFLFGHQKELDNLDLTHLALRLGLEIYRYQTEYEAAANLKRIADDLASAARSGARGTPTFFINGKRYRGKVEVGAMLQAIREAGAGNLMAADFRYQDSRSADAQEHLA